MFKDSKQILNRPEKTFSLISTNKTPNLTLTHELSPTNDIVYVMNYVEEIVHMAPLPNVVGLTADLTGCNVTNLAGDCQVGSIATTGYIFEYATCFHGVLKWLPRQ